MQLPRAVLTLEQQIAEFDAWITPALGSIQQTDRFKLELDAVARTFDFLAEATDRFRDAQDFDPAKIASVYDVFARSLLRGRRGGNGSEIFRAFRALASTLFLVTGKSDNNVKCQLPIHLLSTVGVDDLLWGKRGRKRLSFERKLVPRVLEADKYMRLVEALYRLTSVDSARSLVNKPHDNPKVLLEHFVEFVLADRDSVRQLWSLGRSYCLLQGSNGQEHLALLTPLVIFQVRGSVAASGGHEPEQLLRARMREWGLRPDLDYNLGDVDFSKYGRTSGSQPSREQRAALTKTRAYDFVLPYRTEGWIPRVFVQCQFYAGDSGSVSHKNVDQTTASRQSVSAIADEATFVEYVDGAGYFSSLNGDLRRILSMEDTASFFQVRTAAIRLRRELQGIGFLTPLDVEHAILRTDASLDAVRDCVLSDGYSEEEFDRGLGVLLEMSFATLTKGKLLALSEERTVLARRYLLLDVAAMEGGPIAEDTGSGCLTVPGYGPSHGLALDCLIRRAAEFAPALATQWGGRSDPMEDVLWLCDQGLAAMK